MLAAIDWSMIGVLVGFPSVVLGMIGYAKRESIARAVKKARQSRQEAAVYPTLQGSITTLTNAVVGLQATNVEMERRVTECERDRSELREHYENLKELVTSKAAVEEMREEVAGLRIDLRAGFAGVHEVIGAAK